MRRKEYVAVAFLVSVLSFISTKIIIPDTNTKAATQTASQTAGPNTISMSNSDAVAINAIPTSEQTIYSGTNVLSITNSCPNGAIVTLTTNSNSDTAAANNLIRPGSDDLSKIIAPTTGSSLNNNSWGYSINGGTNYYAVPAKDETPATIYDSTSATSSTESVNVKYGIKMDNNIPSGNYSNDVIYTVAVKPACLGYVVNWDLDGGTGATGATYPTELNWGQTVNLSTLTPTRDGYTFNGWSNGSDTFTGSETGADVNSGNSRSVTMTAQWTALSTLNTISKMQDVTPTICSNTTKNQQYALTDSRDNKTYNVMKLGDNRCWMLQNLRLTNYTLKASDSNVSTNYTIPASQSSWSASYSSPYVYDSGNVSYGVYYNYAAASAGTIISSSNPSQTATSSVCPKGWTIPTSQEWTTMFAALSITNNATGSSRARSAPLSIVYNGYHEWSGSSFGEYNSAAYLWTSSVRAASGGASSVDTPDINATNAYISGLDTRRGAAIRCIAKN